MCDKGSSLCVVSQIAIGIFNAVTGQFAPRTPAGTVAATVVGIEGVVVALGAVAYVALGFVGDAGGTQFAFMLAAVAALAAAGLFFLAKGLWGARRWAGTPAITWQLLQGLVGAQLLSDGQVAFGAIALGVAVVGLAALLLLARGSGSRGQDLHGGGAAVHNSDGA